MGEKEKKKEERCTRVFADHLAALEVRRRLIVDILGPGTASSSHCLWPGRAAAGCGCFLGSFAGRWGNCFTLCCSRL